MIVNKNITANSVNANYNQQNNQQTAKSETLAKAGENNIVSMQGTIRDLSLGKISVNDALNVMPVSMTYGLKNGKTTAIINVNGKRYDISTNSSLVATRAANAIRQVEAKRVNGVAADGTSSVTGTGGIGGGTVGGIKPPTDGTDMLIQNVYYTEAEIKSLRASYNASTELIDKYFHRITGIVAYGKTSASDDIYLLNGNYTIDDFKKEAAYDSNISKVSVIMRNDYLADVLKANGYEDTSDLKPYEQALKYMLFSLYDKAIVYTVKDIAELFVGFIESGALDSYIEGKNELSEFAGNVINRYLSNLNEGDAINLHYLYEINTSLVTDETELAEIRKNVEEKADKLMPDDNIEGSAFAQIFISYISQITNTSLDEVEEKLNANEIKYSSDEKQYAPRKAASEDYPYNPQVNR